LAAIVAEYVRVLFLQFNATPCFFFPRKNIFLVPSFIHKYMYELLFWSRGVALKFMTQVRGREQEHVHVDGAFNYDH